MEIAEIGKLSIIIPVYNGEKFLDKCISSILNQTYNNLEVILVDNCSSDKSLELCKYYESIDNRVFVYQEKKAGASFARNCGISHATGDYITFVDSDDFVVEDAYEILLGKMEKTKADLIIFSYNMVDSTGEKLIKYGPNLRKYDKKSVYSGLQTAKIYITSDDIEGYGWNKLYRYSYFKNCGFVFDENKRSFEDMVTVFSSVLNCPRVVFCNKRLYFYRQIQSSLSHCAYNERMQDFNDSIRRIIEIALAKGLRKECNIYESFLNVLENWRNYQNKEFKKIRWEKGKFKTFINILVGYRTEKIKWLLKMILICIRGNK